MKGQFDVWRFNFPNKGEHPVVLVSHPDICAHAAVVNVLFCTSQRQSRSPKPFEVMLNGADGMDWETFCDCSILYAVPSVALFSKPRPCHTRTALCHSGEDSRRVPSGCSRLKTLRSQKDDIRAF